MNTYSSVKCPFYIKENANQMRCEGVTKGSSTLNSFRYKSQKKKYKQYYCCKFYEECLIAQALLKKYEKEE